MFKLVRRDGARENSGHFEALGHNGTAYKVGQVVALEGGKAVLCKGADNSKVPYGIVAREEATTGEEVIVLRITDEMEFETAITGTSVAKAVPGMALAIGADYGSVVSASASLSSGAYGAIVADTLGAQNAGDKITVRFKV